MVMGTLQVFHHHIYALLEPIDSLYFVTPYIAVDCAICPDILAERSSVSTPMGISIIARQVHKNFSIKVS